MAMSGVHAAKFISSVLVRSHVPLNVAVGELRAVTADQDVRLHLDDLLNAWAAVVLGQTTANDTAGVVRRDLNERQRWALDRARRVGSVTVGDMHAKWPWYCGETLRLDLDGLCRMGELVGVGRTRGRSYHPNGHTSDNAAGSAE
jgi:hypothetical protein